ncbi:hypothetical protein DV737_g2648, partial [Chaetothyriales sp. CBS 132003]
MERPLKRPRLSLFADMQPDAELDRARQKNDLLLKTRFEAIFDKYARDFGGVGDVVDLNTGQIVEDNGHLREMDNEKDAGQPRSRPSKLEQKGPASGRSLLRAMTVAPDRDDSYFSDANADDVIQSIETIAENAALSDDGDTESPDQEDNLSCTDAIEENSRNLTAHDTPCTSDVDSLFEVHGDPGDGDDESTPLQDFTETAIYAKFGPRVGKKVVDLIEKRDMAELHIDPAWRIPVQAQPRHSSSTQKFMDYIHEQAKKKTPTGIRGPRLPVCDFKTMVELHEGAGMTFSEIIDADVLWTLKNDPDVLAFLYFGWRDVEDVTGMDGKPSKEWSKKENKTIAQLLKGRKVGMDTFKRKLAKRSAVEIGNKLADMWLTELHTPGQMHDVQPMPQSVAQNTLSLDDATACELAGPQSSHTAISSNASEEDFRN